MQNQGSIAPGLYIPDANELYLQRANNLSDVADVITARTNIGASSSAEPFVTIGNTFGLSAERALTGTSNQITITDNGAGSTVVLSTPQDIHTAASPTFAGLTLSGLTLGSVLFAGTDGVISQDNSNFFWDNSNEFLGIGTAAPEASMHAVKEGAAASGRWTTYTTPNISSAAVFQRSRGTIGSEAVIVNNDVIGFFGFQGWDGSGVFSGSKAYVQSRAKGTWSSTSHPTDMIFATTTSLDVSNVVLYLSTEGYAGINTGSTTAPTGWLQVKGNTVTVPVAVFQTADDSSTQPIIVARSSAGSNLFRVFGDNGRVASTPSAFTATSSTHIGIQTTVSVTPSGASSANYYGMFPSLTYDSTNGTTGVVAGNLASVAITEAATITNAAGQWINVTVAASTAATITNYYGMKLNAFQVNAAAASNVYGLFTQTALLTTGSITSSYGIFVDAQSLGTGTITNQYGLYIQAIAGASTINEAIHTDNGLINFLSPTGAVVQLGRSDTTASSADSIGKLQFWNNDSHLTTQNIYGYIEVQAAQAIGTDAAAGRMLFATTGTTAGGSPLEAFRIDANQRMSFDGADATAIIELKAGTATANTAPIKFNSGTKLTTAEAGAVEYNGNLLISNATLRFSVGGSLFDSFADVTVGGAEADIYTHTLAANTFNGNGDKVIAEYGGNFVTVGTELTELRVKFAGTTIWDSTGVAPSTGTTSWRVYVELIRVSATVIRYTVSLNTTGASGYVYCTVGELTGLTLSGTNILKITGLSSGVGSGSGDIVGKMGYVKFVPAA